MIEFSEIPIDFVIGTITPYQKESIRIRYYIKQSCKSWKGKKYELYDNLAEELNLSFWRVRKIAKE